MKFREKKQSRNFLKLKLDPPHTFLIFWILRFWIRQNDRWIKTKMMVCWKISQLTSIKFLEKKQSRNFLKLKLDPPPHFLNISSIGVLNTAKWPLNRDENDGMLELITTYVYQIPLKKTVKEFFEIECDPPHTFLIFRVLGFWIRQNDRWIKTKTLVCWKISQLTSIKFLEKNSEK